MTFPHPLLLTISCLAASLFPLRAAEAGPVALLNRAADGAFPLVSAQTAARLITDPADFKVVALAAQCLADDIERVTGRKPAATGNTAVILGTLGKSKLIDGLVAAKKLDVAAIRGKWESYLIATVADPLPGVASGLVIAGSDRRGTAFGAFELSETIGVSPWVWWADVAPTHRDTLFLSPGARAQGSPAVKYRGIFINDEDWGLQPWAAKTFEPETQDIGPKTYAKVCELLLRLKANYLWPAMHPSTKAFNFYPANKTVADDYAIVMGSSHAEPMLRNNVDEWDKAVYGEWDYEKNRAGVLKYWEERVKENGKFENVFTIGMRGLHDSAMPGGGSTADKVARLQRALDDQQAMLARDVNQDVSQVPQAFVPYKEALQLYQNGLRVPEHATLVWPDDNHGYIRQLSTPAERKRVGGGGVYYHISYWGAPADYLWLCTTPPALIWEEMSKAWENGARDIWVLNVGDIKPAEIGMEFFLRMAWNPDAWNEKAQAVFLADWAARNFGQEPAAAIAAILDESYRLNFPAKPEHLQKAQFTDHYQEKATRLKRFAALVEKTDALYRKMPAAKKDAFYQTVVYPVRGSALMNEKYLGPNPAEAHEKIQAETTIYNEQIAGGKWKFMMSAAPRKLAVFQKPAATPVPTAASEAADPHYVSFEAERPSRATAGIGVAWKVIVGLGRSGDSVALRPTTAEIPATAVMEYDFTATRDGPAKVLVYCLPTHALSPKMKLRYSVAVDSGAPVIVDIDTAEFSKPWAANVLRGAAIGSSDFALTQGKHVLKLRPLDPGVVFDKVVIDLGGLKPSYLGPPENSTP
ncbi:glycosyl hydrolase 115 family protein [bacterium]|nr:glycosyl hydrolase 115 family protein [bacterium]